jgi:hypothetical protein
MDTPLKTEINNFPFPQPFRTYILGENKEYFVIRECNPYANKPIFQLRKDYVAAINIIEENK